MKTHDLRSSVQLAQHENHPAIFFQMSDRFCPAAHVFQIRDFARTENPQRIQSLWRYVDMTGRVKRGRGHEEQPLRLDKCPKRVIDFVVDFTHYQPNTTSIPAR